MSDITNNKKVDTQINLGSQEGDINIGSKSRMSSRYKQLKKEVADNTKYDGTFDDLKYYLTNQDSIGLEKKLEDGNFSDKEILRASRRKQRFHMKLTKTEFYESANWINTQLFAKIITDFENHVERPLIDKKATKDEILDAVLEHVVNPVIDLMNTEGADDLVMNYTTEDIYGMVYYLTGKCHINWKDYDSI